MKTKRIINGKEVDEEDFRKYGESRMGELLGGVAPGGTPTTGWPMRSVVLAVHPSQVDEANERNKKRGLATRYEKDGTAVIPDAGDRRKLMKVESEVLGINLVDRDGFI